MFRRIVVPLDTSPLSEEAAWTAAAIARRIRASVHLVHVYEPRLPAFGGGAVIDDQVIAIERGHFERHLLRLAEELAARFGCTCHSAVLDGLPAAAIAKYARQQHADLIVMTSHGRTGLSRAWFGSVADALAHRSPLPVLMVRPGEGAARERIPASEVAFERIVIPLDGSREAEAVLATVRAMRLSPGASHLLAEVVNPVPLPIIDYPDAGIVMPMAPDADATEKLVEQARKHLARIAHKLEREGAGKVETNVVVAPGTGPAIVDLVKGFRADLVALTSHGRGASRLLLGSVADKILRGTHCSILLHRARAAAKTTTTRRAASRKRVTAPRRARVSKRAS
jgi:nucleotide-binding universal stress UspA family protein